VTIFGASHGFAEARRLEVAAGSFLPDLEYDRGAPVAVLGAALARELYREENPLGSVVRVGDARMRVIGVLQPRGVQLGIDVDEVVIVPVATAMQLFNRSSLFRVLIEVRAHEEIDYVHRIALDVLADRHGEEDVTAITQDAVTSSLSNILLVLTLAVAGIGAISLAVAGIGIMNVMLVSVSERTAEVGLLRAVGARRAQVLALFLAEAVALSGLGGIIGLGLSWVALRALEARFPEFPATPPGWAVAAALAVSLAVGALFGVLPARRAARLDPILALQRR
jgi:putative ABC transport system permease protein